MDSVKTGAAGHCVNICDRSSLDMNGIEDVISFDDKCITVKTAFGILTIDGEDLHIVSMSVGSGEMNVTGKLLGMYYTEGAGKKSGMFGKRQK